MVTSISTNNYLPEVKAYEVTSPVDLPNALTPLVDKISQTLPINNQDLRNTIEETTNKLSKNGPISLSLIMAELKKECDRLDYINSEMRNKTQIRSEKKISSLANSQASASRMKGYTSLLQLVAIFGIGLIVGNKYPGLDQAQEREKLFNLLSQISNQIGNFSTNYFEGENIRLGSKVQLEQSKYTDRNQKAQSSEGGKQDRGRMLEAILNAELSAARAG